MAQPRSSTALRRQLRVIAFVAAICLPVLVLWLLLASDEPSVSAQQRPTAQTIQAAQDAVRQIRQVQGATSTSKQVRFDNRMLEGLAILAADASGLRRVTAGVSGGTFTAEASVPLPTGQWINASLAITGEHSAFPELHLGAGHVRLPPWAGRWAAETAHWILSARGAQLPPLDRMISKVAVSHQDVVAELQLPLKTGVIDGVVGAGGAEVNSRIVAQVYCRLTALYREAPDPKLASQVRRTFSEAPASNAESYNRAAFVALALFVVGGPADVLAPSARTSLRDCRRPSDEVLLASRADLAKHWTLSAALGAMLGDEAAAAIGEWKELSDSLPSGSGFSFMDLAADRSGLHVARRATDPHSAHKTTRELMAVTEEQIFPISLMSAQEGLSEQQFIARFGRIDAANYQEVVRWIDRELHRVRPR